MPRCVAPHPEWLLRRSDAAPWYAMHGAQPSKPRRSRILRVLVEPPPPWGAGPVSFGLIGEIVQRCNVDGIQLR